MSTKNRQAKKRIAAKWQAGVFSLADSASVTDLVSARENLWDDSDSVIFDKNQVRLVYKDIRLSLVATVIVSCLLAGAYAMMRL